MDCCIIEQKIELNINISPSNLNNVKEANFQVYYKYKRWDQDFQGVLLDFRGVRVRGDGQIIDELPIIIVNSKFNATLFRPQNGMLLTATVTQISESHLNLLILNLFNGIIHKNQIKDVFYHKKQWFDTKTQNQINEEDQIQFEVLSIEQENDGIFIINGTINSNKKHGLIENINQKYQIQDKLLEYQELINQKHLNLEQF